jgi:hypothetical protein
MSSTDSTIEDGRNKGLLAVRDAAGSFTDVAEFMKRRRTTISNWHSRGVPLDCVPAICVHYGVPPQLVRPDVYTPEIAKKLGELLIEGAAGTVTENR